MKLDETSVTIRERTWLQIMDLALRVCAEHWRAIGLTFLLGAFPLAILNDFLILQLVDFELEQDSYSEHLVFIGISTCLVCIQAPLASVFTIALLGRIMFHEAPDLRQLLRQVIRLAPSWLIRQGILRVSLVSLSVLPLMPHNNRAFVLLVMTLLVLYVGMVRCIRPFLNEVILLERPQQASHQGESVSFGKRMQKLHMVEPGDLIARFLASAVFASILPFTLIELFWFISWIVSENFAWNISLTRLGVPVALWITAAFFTVVRFLGYLDRRTRNEGWAVSLQLRAESQRLLSQVGN